MNVNPKTQLKNFKTPEKSTSLAFFFEINKIFLSIIFIRQFFNLFFTNLLLVILFSFYSLIFLMFSYLRKLVKEKNYINWKDRFFVNFFVKEITKNARVFDFSGVSKTFSMSFGITFIFYSSIIIDLSIFSQNCSSLFITNRVKFKRNSKDD